jgi:outer membrane protein assembly factor BamB
MNLSRHLLIGTICGSMFLGSAARGADWPAYLHDSARSGMTAESLTTPLVPIWTFAPTAAPDPAWAEPLKETARARFDDVFHVVSAFDTVYFGSSGDNQVYALDASNGSVRWTFLTDGPVRLAPAIWKDRLLVGSDDGFVYCLNAESGELIWKRRVADGDDRVIGHGRMMSLWPVRCGVLVRDDVVYAGAGIFPSESIFIIAMNPQDGSVIWRNDVSGERGPEQDRDGISPQGYLLASSSTLFVPSGRNMPAAFSRKDGSFLYYLSGGKSGGTYALLTGDHLIAGVNDQFVYDGKSGKRSEGGYAWSPARRLIVTDAISYSLGDHQIAAMDRSKYTAVNQDRSGVAGEQQQLQADVRTEYRTRYYLNKEDADYQAKYDAATKKIDDMLARIKELGTEQEKIETTAFKWQYETDCRDSMVLAGDKIFAGGLDRVVAVDSASGSWTWTGSVDGRAGGMAVADGRLFVSTTTGKIHCFAQGNPQRQGDVLQPEVVADPYPKDELTPVYRRAANRIVAEAGVDKGFALVLGCGQGRLAIELAKQTNLRIYGIDSDPKNVQAARRAVQAAGLYGSRITIDQGSFSDLPYPDYFANLIVSDQVITDGKVDAQSKEMFRVLRPAGGVAVFGQPAEAAGIVKSLNVDQFVAWLGESEAPEAAISRDGGTWARIRRDKLAGAGSWTHQYGNPEKTANSNDQLVKTPLGVIWFGNPGPDRMVERHARAAAPLSLDGQLFVQGENVVMAYDAYNGTLQWKREIPGAVRVRVDVDGSNFAVTEKGLYVAARDQAFRLDRATGKTLKTYTVPAVENGSPRRWGFLASVGDTLFGTTALPLQEEYGARWQNVSDDPIENLKAYGQFFTSGGNWRYMQQWPDWGREDTWKGGLTNKMITSESVFALDVETGESRWVYSGIIGHCTLTIADGIIFFADANVTEEEKKTAVAARREKYGKLSFEEDKPESYAEYDVRRLMALEINTGDSAWERVLDCTGSGGDKMGTAYHDGKLMVLGHFSNHDGGAFAKGGLNWRRVTVLNAEDGYDLWSKELNYLRRPMMMGDSMIVEPRAVDINTGEFKMRTHPVTGQQVAWEFKRGGHSCGITTGSADCFFLRSDSINYYDFKEDTGMLPIGGTRAGCWINMIPANGLVLLPEASAGCTCSFPIRSTLVMAPKKRDRTWSIYVTPGQMTPVKHWYLNFGAPGDFKDGEGHIWFGYPRLGVPYGVKFTLNEEISGGQGFYAHGFEAEQFKDTESPRVFSSGVTGMKSCRIPLVEEGQPAQRYTVKLGFCDPVNDKPGQRVFDVKLQGKTVLKDFDIAGEAGKKCAAIQKAFEGIEVADNLIVEMVPKSENLGNDAAPLLNSIEILR